MVIQYNSSSQNSYNFLKQNQGKMQESMEKISSGFKINRAGDAAAQLCISEKMRCQLSGLGAAMKNVKDGISLIKVGEGALQEVHDMLNRMKELAVLSANGTFDNEVDRFSLQQEVGELKTEIDRIADSTNFNGIYLLNGTGEFNDGTYDFGSGGSGGSDGSEGSGEDNFVMENGIESVILNGQVVDAADVVETFSKEAYAYSFEEFANIYQNNGYTGTATFELSYKDAQGVDQSVYYGLIVKDGGGNLTDTALVLALRALTTHYHDVPCGIFSQDGYVYVRFEDDITDVKLTVSDVPSSAKTELKSTKVDQIYTQQIDLSENSFQEGDSVTIGGVEYQWVGLNSTAVATDTYVPVKSTSLCDRLVGGATSGTGVDTKTFLYQLEVDFGLDVAYGYKNSNYIYFTGKVNLEGNVQGTPEKEEEDPEEDEYLERPVRGAWLKLQIGDQNEDFDQLFVPIFYMYTHALKVEDFQVDSQEEAQEAIDKAEDAINMVSSCRGEYGALQNRLEHTYETLSVATENMQDAESTIRDTDVAMAMMKFTKSNIMNQAAQSMLSQANQLPQGVLKLIS